MVEVPVYEPTISEEYLKSNAEFLPTLSKLFEKDIPIFIKPKSLDSTQYLLKVFQTHDQPQFQTVYIELVTNVDDSTDPISDRDKNRTYIMLFNFNKDNMIQGDIHNNSRRTAQPMKGFTSVIAPIEDAICTIMAKKQNRKLRRTVNTSHEESSNLAQAYIKRGYEKNGVIGEIGAFLYKDFE